MRSVLLAGRRQRPMSVRYQIVIDATDSERLARFWVAALGYVLEPPPEGYASWRDYYQHLGVKGADLDIGPDSIVDPRGEGPRIWLHQVPEEKIVKNRLHFDTRASGERNLPWSRRRTQVEVEVSRLEALGAQRWETDSDAEHDRYAVGMVDPEGNEFDVH